MQKNTNMKVPCHTESVYEPIDMLCPRTNRPIECFSLDSLELICPTCLMFGAHKGHNVASIPEATKIVKNDIDKAIREGLFKSARTSSILLDIRHTKLQCEEARDKLSKEIHELFTV